MALVPKMSNAAATAAANTVGALLNGGNLRIYSGTQPADADTNANATLLLAEIVFNATAFGTPVNGVMNANAFTPDSSANSAGTATWFRATQSGNNAVIPGVFDGTVGTSGCNLNLNSDVIAAGAAVTVTGFTYTQSKT